MSKLDVLSLDMFNNGKVFTRKDFIKIASTLTGKQYSTKSSVREYMRTSLSLVKTQKRINKVLRLHGRYLKSVDCYQKWEVLEDEALAREITRYERTANSAAKAKQELETGTQLRLSYSFLKDKPTTLHPV